MLPGSKPLRPVGAGGAAAFENPKVLPNQQTGPLTVQQPATSDNTALASAGASDWSIVDSPNGPPSPTESDLYGATCVSASDCWAVGTYIAGLGNPQHTLVEHWDGSSWTIVNSPNTDSAQSNFLSGVTCVSTSDCWAVGSYGDIYQGPSPQQTLIEHWDGTSWAIVSSPNPGTTFDSPLVSVTCPSATDCWAVGSYYSYDRINHQTLALQTLIEHWDGNSWTIVSSPNTSSTQFNYLLSVSCVSQANCWAAGTYFTGSVQQTLIEHWDGNSWTIASSPNTSATQFNLLYGVACVSTGDCWAAGFYAVPAGLGSVSQTLIEHWDGTSWTIATSPNTLNTENNYLYGVTCSSASDCWAVGYYDPNPTVGVHVDQTLIEHWDGSSWAIVTSANTLPTQNNFLNGVTCVSGAAECVAVGYYYNGTDYLTLTERWDGNSWAIVTSPNPLASQRNYFTGVTCVSTSDCWAVGYYYTGTVGKAQTLIEHWNGTSWTVTSSPNTDTAHHNFLYGVACATASDCWAVGRNVPVDGNGVVAIDQTLIEHWDGTSWAVVTSPDTSPAENNVLYAVSCVSTTECWAVGHHNRIGSAPQSLIERWDGTSWAIVTSPNNSSQYHTLAGVTCASQADCWAVGYYFAGTAYQTLIEHWDGSSWAIVSSPSTLNTQANYLNSVTCASASQCWAVGSYNVTSNTAQTLIEQWDGTSWTIVNSPNISDTQNNQLFGVSCLTSSDCFAVGYYFANYADQTLIEHWDGTSWAIVSSPNSDSVIEEKNDLAAVTCASGAADCWAVGYSGVGLTLTEHYRASTPLTLTSVVSRKSHGSAGAFDVDLPLTGNPGIECRNGGTNGDYTLVFTFANTLASVTGATVSSGTGSVTGSNIDGSDAHNYMVNLTGVTNVQVITVSLAGVRDSVGNSSSVVSASMGMLLGDVNASRRVDAADVSSVRQQTLQSITSSNFRNDLNASGRIDAADVSIARQQTLTSLP